MSPVTICTLWEKDYHKGLGAFVNSLVPTGYTGRVWAGYRGDLPPWATAGCVEGDTCTFSIPGGIELVFCKIHVPIHFAQYKAAWIARVLTELEPEASGIYYFDPDIFVLAKWSFFEQWLDSGIAVCEDVNYPINRTHPLTKPWKEYAEKLGFTHWKPIDVYLNSGLLGIPRHAMPFLDDWQRLLSAMQQDFSLGEVLKTGTRADMFHATDQDALTVAAAVTEQPISFVGLDGMSFGESEGSEWLTVHALSKPWRRRVFRDLFQQGHKPDVALRLYWSHAGGPIQVESRRRVLAHRIYLPIASLLARFYNRPGRLLSS